MGLFVEGWHVAYRNKKCGSILNDTETNFCAIPNPWHGWCADPFVFEYKEQVYIFAELFDYIKDYAGIGYCVLDKKTNKFSKWKVVIEEQFHMSYPFLFERDGNVYMLPETSGNNSLIFYRAEEFPEVWVKEKILLDDIQIVDTTLDDVKEQEILGQTYKLKEDSKWELWTFKMSDYKICFSESGPMSNDDATARPGGRFFNYEDKKFRVSQDCEKSYGYALNFMEVAEFSKDVLTEKLVKYISPDDIHVDKHIKITGIHTYNATENFEVIDVKSVDYNLLYFFFRICRKIKRVIKNGK